MKASRPAILLIRRGKSLERDHRRAHRSSPWKSPKADFSTSLGNPANGAGLPLSYSHDGCRSN